MFRTTLATAALALAAGPALAEAHGGAMVARIVGADETLHGTVTVTPLPSGIASVLIDLEGLPAGGLHGMHVHETGDCSAGDFTSAGGHLADGREHGAEVEGGPHPGDLPNTQVAADGTVRVEYFNHLLTAEMMMDEDGAAFIIHAGQDDYASQPAGDAGARIACGTFEAG